MAKKQPKKRVVRPTSKKESLLMGQTESPSPVIPRHQWTNGGTEVLIVKLVGQDGKTYNGFEWPLTVGATVEAPDWNTTPKCGGGLHGWPWGFSIGDGVEPNWSATWLVFGALPTDVIDLGGKVKAKCGTVRFVGSWNKATEFVLSGQMAWVAHASSGAASATGESGAASATGDCSLAAVTGTDGRVRGGPYSAIALAWWNDSVKRAEMRCAEIGVGDGFDGKLKANVWYRLSRTGQFVEESV